MHLAENGVLELDTPELTSLLESEERPDQLVQSSREAFLYSNPGYAVLELLIEEASEGTKIVSHEGNPHRR